MYYSIFVVYFQLDSDTSSILKELQSKLNSVLDHLSSVFAKSLEPQIKQSTQELGQLLSKVKGAGQVSLSQPSQRNSIQQESEMVLKPLMELIDGRHVDNISIHSKALIGLEHIYIAIYIVSQIHT